MIILDVEASGLNPEKHSILSIGALEFERPDNRFYGECRVWDNAHIQDEALKVNGFSREDATNSAKQPESELVIAFLEWTTMIEDRTLVGQNPAVLDRPIIEAAAHRAGREVRLAHRTIDTHSVAYTHYVLHGKNIPFDRQKNHSALDLDTILRYVGLPPEPRPHNALTGALLEAEALSRLFYNKALLEEYQQYRIPWV
jgi:DNA polymerase-3 subunit epsilon